MGTRFFEKLITFIFDVLTINAAFAATFWLRYISNVFPETYNPALNFAEYVIPSIILTVAWVLLFFFTGLYRNWYKESRIDEFLVVTRTVLFGIFLLFILISADEIIHFATTGIRPVLLTKTQFGMLSTYAIIMLLFATVNRFAMHTLWVWLFSKGIGIDNVLIVGSSQSGETLVREICSHPQLGYRVIGFADDDGRKKGGACAGLPVLGTYSMLPEVIKKNNVKGIIISEVSSSPNEILRILNYALDSNVTIYLVPSLMDVIAGHLKTHQIFGVPLIVLLQDHMPSWEAQIKRIMDILSSLMILICGAPLWLITAVIIRANSPGPILFKQERVGQNGRQFIMIKFRSMYKDAEKMTGPTWATEDDPRITPVGRFLRKTRLDEIPQFINVLRGEMSLVGPRPERAYFIEMLKQEIPWYIKRIKMKPGITGWAQVKHKYDATIEDVKQKVMYDLYYFENMSILLDIKIIVRTLLVVVTGKGAR